MRPLDRNLRNQLEAAINEAREIAEKAARAALEQLGVQEAAPYDFLDEDALASETPFTRAKTR